MEIRLFHRTQQFAALEHTGSRSRLPIPVPGHDGLLEIRLELPILDIQCYWTPELRTPSSKIHWTIETNSAGQRHFPWITFFNTCGVNRFSLGLTDLTDDCRITAKMNQERCVYEITVAVALHRESRDFELVLDERPVPWTEALADWRNGLNLPKVNYPDGAWKPVFCTWYAVHAAVTQDWVEKNAEIAAKLGFGTLIIDDGWCFDTMKRVAPETIGSWYEWIGDWNISKRKFPDFAGHCRRVKAMGMKYLFWVAPFLIGEKSEFRKQFPDGHRKDYHEGCYVIDSGKADAMNAQLEKMKHVMRDYGLDGLKVDFLDYIKPNIEEPEGRETMKFIRELAAALREMKPDALIEFRQAYATPGMAPYGTQFRAGDVPFDFVDNFQRLAQIRVSMGDRIPVHADPVYWHPAESPVNISRHMIASLTGVPMLSMDLLKISETERKIIRRWLDFYENHLPTFRDGRWQAVFHQSNAAYVTVSHDGESIVILLDPARLNQALEQAEKRAVVLNLSLEELRCAGAESADCEGNPGKKGVIPPGGSGCVNR